MRKLLLILCMTFLFFLSANVYAKDPLMTYSVDNVERIFTDKIEFSSIQNIGNMDLIKPDLEQIVLCSQ